MHSDVYYGGRTYPNSGTLSFLCSTATPTPTHIFILVPIPTYISIPMFILSFVLSSSV